jgi:hypothetical protein
MGGTDIWVHWMIVDSEVRKRDRRRTVLRYRENDVPTHFTMYSRVGRFMTKIWFWMRVPLEYIHFYVKVPKPAKKTENFK